MKCSKCRHENRVGAKFCEECATPLARGCPNCASELPATAKFCPECAHPVGAAQPPPVPASPGSYTPIHLAEKILTSKSALEGERKQVTVLFADLKGSMELLSDRDPEVARKLLDPVIELMMEAVHRYEGTVNQVMGDGIMALFGAPLAHEDHAVRACYSALRMQESAQKYAEEARRTYGVPIRLRVGLNSGEVLVRAIGSDLHMDYTAVGQTTHLAARMEQLADPGTVLLAPDTMALAEGFVIVKSMGPTAVKGRAAPIEVYRLDGASDVRGRLQAAVLRGLTRFVGRDAEFERLREALQRAAGGRGQVAAIVGEPGVGKSRLAWEFMQSPGSGDWLILRCAAVSYGKSTTYLPVIELLRGYFGIEPRDDRRKSREKVTGKILSLDRSLEPMLPVFLSLLEVSIGDPDWEQLAPLERKRRTQDALKRLFLRESQVQPVLLVFEDLHWIDSETQAFLDLLVEGLPTARLLLLANYRPEYRHAWATKTYYRLIGLDTLATATAAELLEGLLGADPSTKELKLRLIERTDCNPFFLEESVRALVETGALEGARGAYRTRGPSQSLQLPATAQAILAARIDRLPVEDKRLLQAAAVIGKDVPFPLLHAIAEQSEEDFLLALGRLQAAEFLYEARLFPEIEYTFKHALSHEVALGGLLQDRRSALHARILASMEQLYADRLGEHVERLAHHSLRGAVHEKAAVYLRQAGLKASGRLALQDARDSFEQALGILKLMPESATTLQQAFDIYLELRPVLISLGEIRPSLERAREAEVIARRLNDDLRTCQVFATMTSSHALLGELDEAVQSGTRALEIARRLGETKLQILSTSVLAQTHYYRGDYDRVVELATANLAVLPAEWVYEYLGNIAPASIFDRILLVMSLAELGRFDEGVEVQAEAIRLALPTKHALHVAIAYRAAGTLYLLKGDWSKARGPLDHWIDALQAGNIALQIPSAIGSRAWALAQLGEQDEALAQLDESEQFARTLAEGGLSGYLGWAYFSMGRASMALGMADRARGYAHRVIESSPHHLGYAAHALHLLGDIAAQPGGVDPAGAEPYYREALALADARGIRPIIAHCRRGLGNLYRRTGRSAEAAELLASAVAMYRELDMAYWLADADAPTSHPQ